MEIYDMRPPGLVSKIKKLTKQRDILLNVVKELSELHVLKDTPSKKEILELIKQIERGK
jgi:hypothetical protein